MFTTMLSRICRVLRRLKEALLGASVPQLTPVTNLISFDMAITERDLDAYKAAMPGDAKLQKLTLQELLTATAGEKVDWKTLKLPSRKTEQLLEGSTPECVVQVGFVVFDCVCLFLGATALRDTINENDARAVGEAAEPALSQFEKYIEVIEDKDSSTAEVAKAVFDIITTVYTADCLGAVFSAFLGSLTWYTATLYAVTGMATIVAALATDGAAEIALMVVELATFGFLVNDSINAGKACSFS